MEVGRGGRGFCGKDVHASCVHHRLRGVPEEEGWGGPVGPGLRVERTSGPWLALRAKRCGE